MGNINMEMTLEEQLGVEAIVYLNAQVGHTEPKWVTLRNWRCFTDPEKKFTMDTYRRYKQVEEDYDNRLTDILRDGGDGIPDSGDVLSSPAPSGDIPGDNNAGEAGGSDSSDLNQTTGGDVDSSMAVA